MYPKSNLKLGDWKATCDICGFDFHASDLRKNWRGLYVCKKDFEPREELDFLRGVPDNPNVPWTRPDTTAAIDKPISPWNISGSAIAGFAVSGFFLIYNPPL